MFETLYISSKRDICVISINAIVLCYCETCHVCFRSVSGRTITKKVYCDVYLEHCEAKFTSGSSLCILFELFWHMIFLFLVYMLQYFN